MRRAGLSTRSRAAAGVLQTFLSTYHSLLTSLPVIAWEG